MERAKVECGVDFERTRALLNPSLAMIKSLLTFNVSRRAPRNIAMNAVNNASSVRH